MKIRIYKAVKSQIQSRRNSMNYNYSDGAASPSNRQAPPPSQNMNHVNGVNGAAVLPGMIAGLPTPAGHQSDLNYVYGMVEELSRTLAESRAASERINAAVGRVRQRAIELNMTNDEIVTFVSDTLNGKYPPAPESPRSFSMLML